MITIIPLGVNNFVTFTMEKESFEVEDPELADHLVSLPIHLSLLIEKGASQSQGSVFSFFFLFFFFFFFFFFFIYFYFFSSSSFSNIMKP